MAGDTNECKRTGGSCSAGKARSADCLNPATPRPSPLVTDVRVRPLNITPPPPPVHLVCARGILKCSNSQGDIYTCRQELK